MQTMHLFAGIGGGLLADRILGHDPIIAVEWDRYACQVLRERAADGWFPNLQVWEGDVRLFDPSEYAGRVDCIHAGFPCQDISVVGNQAGVGEETRSGLYREVIRIARILRTKYIYLENVAAIVSNGLGTVIADLAALGYDIEWLCLRASDCGANHHRDRWWGLCTNTNGNKRGASSMGQNSRTDGWDDVGGICEVFSDTGLHGICQRRQSANVGEDVQYGSGIQCNGVSGFGIKEGEVLADADITRCERHRNSAKRRKEEYSESCVPSWWQTESDVGRVVNGIPNRIHRLKGLGNAQVPLQAAVAFSILMDRHNA